MMITTMGRFLFLFLVPIHGFQQLSMVPSLRPTLVALPLSFDSSVQADPSVRPTSPLLLQSSATALLSCMATWAAIRYTGWSAVRASSAIGFVSSLIMSPTFAAASFCGSFAGMSGHIHASSQTAFLLGLACGAVLYIWNANGIQTGKGGRLGTIAFLGNVLFDSIRNGGPGGLIMGIQNTLTPVTAATAAVSGALSIVSRRLNKEGKRNLTLLHQVSKAVLLGSLLRRLLTNGVSLEKWSISAAYIFVSSVAVKWTTPRNGAIMAASLVGLLGSFTPWATAIYLGAFIGMTGREDFQISKLLQASLFSAVLHEFGLFHGFGGRLGFFAFLGVNFGL